MSDLPFYILPFAVILGWVIAYLYAKRLTRWPSGKAKDSGYNHWKPLIEMHASAPVSPAPPPQESPAESSQAQSEALAEELHLEEALETISILSDPDACEMLQRGLQDIRAGRLIDHEDVKRELL